MNVVRFALTLVALLAVAALPDSSSVRGASAQLNSGPSFRFGLDWEVGADLAEDFSALKLEPLSDEAARKANLLAPFAKDPLEVALPMALPPRAGTYLDHASAADCLTAAIYYEAATEPVTGKRAVAQVILNRVRHPAFPNSVCAVVMQGSNRATGCQFTFTCDGSLYRRPSQVGWQSARQIALAALSGAVEPSAGLATHYHASYVRPYWASSLDKIALIGNHIFYRWPGAWGRTAAFNQAVKLEEDYAIHRGVQWKMAASYLFDAGAQSPPMDLAIIQSSAPQAPANPASLPEKAASDGLATPPPSLRADQERGTLLIDETYGTLIAN